MKLPVELKHVEKATRVLADAEGIRDDCIRDAHRAGWSYRQIAVAAGVSFQRVAQIVKANDKEES